MFLTFRIEQTKKEVKKEYPIDFVMGKFNPEVDAQFVEIPPSYSSRKGMYMQSEAYSAFVNMAKAAKKDDVELTIISATRNFFRQKSIWEAKWNGQTKVGGKDLSKNIANPTSRALKILEFSSMPGTSRHHWGTDIDINAFENDYFEKGKGLKEYNWLIANGPKYGFCQPYTPKDASRPNGYNEEKWHWSYIPLAKKLSDQANIRLKDTMIRGFQGAETAKAIGIVEKFVLGINKECL